MKKILILVSMLNLIMISSSLFAAEAEDFEGQLPNAVELEEGLIGGAVPTPKAIELAAAKGYKTIIDVRSPEEGTAAEQTLVEKTGMRYVNIPTTVDNLSRKQADQLNEVLSAEGSKPAVLHCASGNRAAAVWATYQKFHKGAETDAIIQEASQKGVTKDAIKQRLKEILV